MGVSMVITSGKGGVGKSTVSVGLGRALAGRGRRVLLLDCDAGLRSLDRMTGTESQLVYDSSDVVNGRCAPKDAIYAVEQRLDVMPAPSNVKDMIAAPVMKKLIPFLKNHYDYVLMDSPAGVGRGFMAASCAADRAFVVCSADAVSVRSASTVRDLLVEQGVEDMGLLINRLNVDMFTASATYSDLDAVIDETAVRLYGVIPEDFSLAAAFLNGRAAAPNSIGMRAMQRIAGRIEGEMIPIGI